MVANKKNNNDAIGILFPNIGDERVPALVADRLVASIPFASRYRLVDFTLSGMVGSDITDISMVCLGNYNSLLDHLGSGREWDLARKNGGIHLYPPFSWSGSGLYNGRVEALYNICKALKGKSQKYVVMSNVSIAANIDYKAIVEAHANSGADVTSVYIKEPISKSLLDSEKGFYYTYTIGENDQINKIMINEKAEGVKNVALGIHVIDREWLIDKINAARLNGATGWERDVLIPHLGTWDIRGYEYTGYVARINSLGDYFTENMKLLDDDNLDALFSGHPIYTKIRDDNPTRYIGDAKAENAMLADGCVIEGEVYDSILFKGVKIGKGAKVTNCILMQDTVVEAGASLDHVIADKNVLVTEGKSLKGELTHPVYVRKFDVV